MDPFDLLKSPLKGTYLIEASAGTGKTYTLEGLVVRLIITHHLPIEQILAVTFTNNAVEELKNRIRKKLLSTKHHLNGDASNDAFIEHLCNTIQDPPTAREKIDHALVDFDKAGIYTIHGFCQRILAEQAFETNVVFDTDIAPDPSDVINDIANDFWRKNFYFLPAEILNYIRQTISGPDYFVNVYNRFYHPDAAVLPQPVAYQIPDPGDFRSSIQNVRVCWKQDKEVVLALLADPSLDGRKYGKVTAADQKKREIKLQTLGHQMDAFLSETQNAFPLFSNFGLFSQATINNSTRKNKAAPVHPFFDLCQELMVTSDQLAHDAEQFVLALKLQFLDDMVSQLNIKKQQHHFMDFDDLLTRVRDALNSPSGDMLGHRLRKSYKAVLVDEFQDTDSVQYDIFSTLFSNPEHTLYFIGDPKQAIYGFRGADVFSYMKAADQADASFTLQHNWRSTPGLIQAVNTIFSNQPHAFLFEKIPFQEITPGDAHMSEKDAFSPALSVWHLFSEQDPENTKPLSVEQATDIIATSVAAEIIKISGPPHSIPFKDMAVLVRTNRQATLVMQYLTAKTIPSVVYYAGNIFDTVEAVELQRVLWGLADPNNERKLKAALATQLLGVQAIAFDDTDIHENWERRIFRLQRYAILWKKQSFMRMFKSMIAEEAIQQRLMGFSDGERRLTNLLHLGELLHQADMDRRPGVQGLVKWLGERMQKRGMESDDHLLRLEKDAHAVKIVTIHKSKGLEYPVVFCPFGWESAGVPETPAVQFHDPRKNNTLTSDFGSDQLSQHKLFAQHEKLAENVRLYYVALTRARQKCYLAWGRIRNAETSAPAYLFHCPKDISTVNGSNDVLTEVKKALVTRNDKMLLEDLKDLALRSSNTIELVNLTERTEDSELTVPESNSQLHHRHFSHQIDHSWKVTSYSNLASTHDAAPEKADRDGVPLFVFPEADETDIRQNENPFSDVLYFPKGTYAGLFFHDLFEHLDFGGNETDHHTLILEKLEAYNIPKEWQHAVFAMVKHITTTPLLLSQPDLMLSNISMGDRINEMEFYYPIQNIDPSVFKNTLFENADLTLPEIKPEATFDSSLLRGFMRGFIDLIFQHKGKYYILDWKSNYLGSNVTDYSLGNIQNAMMDHNYHLQYMIYVVALHQYLSSKLIHYDYEVHFGGVFYLFLRGVRSELGSDAGVFYDRPEFSQIKKLLAYLIES